MSSSRSWSRSLLLTCISLCLLSIARCESLLDDVVKRSNDSLLWGAYRPNLYVGVRPRIPKSLMAGLMWTNVDTYGSISRIRHACEQSEDMGYYGWDSYDARLGGHQVIDDYGMGIKLDVDFVKLPEAENGQNWALRVRGTPKKGAPEDIKTAMFFYTYLEGEGILEIQKNEENEGSRPYIVGETPDLGTFLIATKNRFGEHPTFLTAPNNFEDAEETVMDSDYYISLNVEEDDIWKMKDVLLQLLDQKIRIDLQAKGITSLEDLPPAFEELVLPNVAGNTNVQIVEKVFEGAFEFDIIYNSVPFLNVVTEDVITAQIESNKAAFKERFEQTFPIAAPFKNESSLQLFSQRAFANLYGGIGYFYGNSIVSTHGVEDAEDGDYEFAHGFENADMKLQEGTAKLDVERTLFTATPSRPHFARGFYWDEGFHLIPLGLWDTDLSLEILQSWFSLIDEKGWLGREQILGPEARSQVPAEFQTQYPDIANPPTLILALKAFIEQMKSYSGAGDFAERALNQEGDGVSGVTSEADLLRVSHLEFPELTTKFLRSLYPKLRKHYYWFRDTQAGDLESWERDAFSDVEGYRWRGRTYEHCLASGLDDYPRAQPPSFAELHVDLMSWMISFTKNLRFVAEFLGEEEDAATFAEYENNMMHNLDDLHWDEDTGMYCDASVDEYDDPLFVCHTGYVSLMPLMLGLLPSDSPKLGRLLEVLRDEDELWSPYGIRSLSRSDRFYGQGENYWRGPIWINMNYMVLSSLYKNYMQVSGPYQELATAIYNELRVNVVNTVYREWARSGIFYEQYNSETGVGQRTKGFTGWTSLVVNILSEQY
ncbi:glucosidase I Gls1 [Schizosaccharomyces japonicus yFS275]|uniref:Mannosyl-oligosaccharide glucosidase n=1 Tax=Schizosaccharomyces japonicus (strain yFS275 / FY16936) TaxID=402676 RepID=B6K6M6_SCHJY|nr:glucosidase I Gls1 [Schizosaccharomyces japonicus yFS275]EEB09180.1 glucosidase I Gls1 [Schizosaccharomyces japonicus yFS275]